MRWRRIFTTTTTIVYLSKNLDLRLRSFFDELFIELNKDTSIMTTYDQIVEEGVVKGLIRGRQEGREEGREETFRGMLRIARRQGIDIDALANQYDDLPADRIRAIVAEVKAE
jgi:hypothetical protein